MNKRALMLSTLLGAMALAPAAFAQPDSGWYSAFDLGYHWPSGWDATSSNNASDGRPYQFDFQTENKVVGFARLGYRINPNWRVELEGGSRPGNIESARGDPARPLPNQLCSLSGIAPCRAPGGSIKAWTLMGNVIYDFFPESQFRPFIGAGVGVNRADVRVAARGNVPVGAIDIDDTYTAFSWQLLAGVSFDVSDRMNVDLTYRYLDGSDLQINSTNSSPAFNPGDFNGGYADQSVTFGLRYAFGAPAAAPPPPPPPPQYEAREFIVYFPFDQYVLTPEAQSVVSEAAQYAQAGGATRVVVVGHTDSSGSPAYNVRLSERRAKAVADALVGLGVSAGTLAVDWKGETDLAVATGDGVKEPLNRRSTISINF